MKQAIRYEILENHLVPGLQDRIARENSLPLELVVRALNAAAVFVAGALRSDSTAYLRVEGKGVIASGIAGVFRLLPGVELAVRPKFLSESANTWERDFAAAIAVSMAGRLLPQRQVHSDFGIDSDFARLTAVQWMEDFRRERARPLRTYRREPHRDFDLIGDVDWSELGTLDERGFPQSALRLTRRNQFNSIMAAAAATLADRIADSGTHAALREASATIAGSAASPLLPLRKRFPTRAKAWSPLFELSRDVLDGRSPQFGSGKGRAPGYVFRTWPVWEALCERALQAGWPIRRQATVRLGTRGGSAFNVRPDIQLTVAGGVTIIVDAKYKRRDDDGKNVISSTDAYEALAFMEAADSPLAILLYPSSGDTSHGSALGNVEVAETIQVGARRIVAGRVTTASLGSPGGLASFAGKVSADIAGIIEHAVGSVAVEGAIESG